MQTIQLPKIKWVHPKKILGKTIYDCIPSTGQMIDQFVRCGLLKNATGNYSTDVYQLCRNGATWLGAQMKSLGLEVEIIEGTFLGDSHCWVVLGDYYFDTTIAQVDSSYPEFACVLIRNAKGYEEFLRFPLDKWLKKHM